MTEIVIGAIGMLVFILMCAGGHVTWDRIVDGYDLQMSRLHRLESEANAMKKEIEELKAKHAMADEDIKRIYSLPVVKKDVLDMLAWKEKESHETI